MDSFVIGIARRARAPNNFQNIIPIWPPGLLEIIKIAITISVFVIDTYIWTLWPSAYPKVIGGPGPFSISHKNKSNMAAATS